MNVFALASLSFGMSMDAFAAATAKGATNKTPDLLTAFRGGLLFGVVEAIAPLVGFGLGTVASDVVASFDHWLAFGLLAFLGVRFIYQAWLADELGDDQPEQITNQGRLAMMITAIATSIDSVVVGVSLAFLAVNIWLACLFIGVATTVMATVGLYLGNRLGQCFGRWAMGLGGLVLIVIGVLILYTHLTA